MVIREWERLVMAEKSSSDIVLSAAVELANNGQTVTRETLCQATGLKLSIVDDRVKVLIDDGLMVRIERGVFKPCTMHAPTRVISKTVLTDGSVKLDIGDDVLDLTPHEAMVLGRLLMGDAVALSSIEAGNQAALANGAMMREIAALKRKLNSLETGSNGLFGKVE